jgi:hypothetical protein
VPEINGSYGSFRKSIVKTSVSSAWPVLCKCWRNRSLFQTNRLLSFWSIWNRVCNWTLWLPVFLPIADSDKNNSKHEHKEYDNIYIISSGHWPRGLRHELSSSARTLGSWVRIPLKGMDVCMCVYSVFLLSCVQVVALRQADPPSKEVYRLCKKRLRNWRRGQSPTKGWSITDEWINILWRGVRKPNSVMSTARQRLVKDHCWATLGNHCIKAGILKSKNNRDPLPGNGSISGYQSLDIKSTCYLRMKTCSQ